MKSQERPLVWLHGEVKTPPLTSAARIEAGYLLRQLQMGLKLSYPIHGQCLRLVQDVTNYESTTKTRLGA
jgi:hypothetical protein